MWMCQQAIFGASSNALQDLGLNPKSLAVLAISSMLQHPQEIALSLGAPFPTISNILKELEKLQYVQRSSDSVDRRKTILKQTDKGRKAMSEAVELVNREGGPLLSNLSEQELETLHSLLIKLTSHASGPGSTGC